MLPFDGDDKFSMKKWWLERSTPATPRFLSDDSIFKDGVPLVSNTGLTGTDVMANVGEANWLQLEAILVISDWANGTSPRRPILDGNFSFRI
ncbi:hypothetical protein HRI_000679900 [Hibiscus trionum]|uniref:Uncharacterized protein n=1 Tax=Hibiscus trionum TaxID=183268 RepID=A0A9W7H4Z5_HIBTR|nr:hypothetical protein HRI_000679900 [Hibiscus trionum]